MIIHVILFHNLFYVNHFMNWIIADLICFHAHSLSPFSFYGFRKWIRNVCGLIIHFSIDLSLLLIHFVTPNHMTCDNLFLAAILDYLDGFRKLSSKFQNQRNLSFHLTPEVASKLVENIKIV